LGANPNMTPTQVDYAIKTDATPNVVSLAGTGSPNRLLYSMNSGNGGSVEPPPATPTLTVNGTSLSFGSVTTGQTSSVQSYTLSGADLTSNVTVSAPSGFQVSLSSSSGFGSSVSVTPSSGLVTDRTIYVRFAPTAAQSYSGTVNNSSSGATSKTVQVSGTGVAPVGNAITLTGTASRNNRNRWVAALSWSGITTTRVDLYVSSRSGDLGSRFARVSTSGSGSYNYTMSNTGTGTRYFRACNSGSTTQCSPVLTLSW
jgi:hypothetical protein